MSSTDGSKIGSNILLPGIDISLKDTKIEATDDGGFIIVGKDNDILGDLRFYKYTFDNKLICSTKLSNSYSKTGNQRIQRMGSLVYKDYLYVVHLIIIKFQLLLLYYIN